MVGTVGEKNRFTKTYLDVDDAISYQTLQEHAQKSDALVLKVAIITHAPSQREMHVEMYRWMYSMCNPHSLSPVGRRRGTRHTQLECLQNKNLGMNSCN